MRSTEFTPPTGQIPGGQSKSQDPVTHRSQGISGLCRAPPIQQFSFALVLSKEDKAWLSIFGKAGSPQTTGPVKPPAALERPRCQASANSGNGASQGSLAAAPRVLPGFASVKAKHTQKVQRGRETGRPGAGPRLSHSESAERRTRGRAGRGAQPVIPAFVIFKQYEIQKQTHIQKTIHYIY